MALPPLPLPSRSPVGLACIAAAFGLTVSGIAFAGQIKGHLTGVEKLLNPVWNEAKDVSLHRFTWREPSPTVRGEFRNLFAYAPKEVCVAALASTPQQAPPTPLLVTIGGGRTTPVTIVVAPGTRLHFENRDPFPHKLYAVGQSTFPPGETAAPGTRDWTAPGPGRYEIRDELAPSVRSWVVVEPNLAGVAYPQSNGQFTFAALPAGEYTVKAYFDGTAVTAPKPLALGGGAADIALQVEPPVDKGGGDKDKGGDKSAKESGGKQ